MKALQRLAIHGAPRSGTTWLGEILNSNEHVIYKYQPLFSYAFKSFLDENASADRITQFFSRIAETPDTFLDQTEQRERGIMPTFRKATPTHIVYKEVRYHNILANLLQRDTSLRLIALVRNPLAVIASWLQAPKEFRADLGWPVSEWRAATIKNAGRPEEYNGFERWKESTRLFQSLQQRYPDRVLLLRYSDLLIDTEKHTKNICEFAGLDYTEQMRLFVQSSRQSNEADAYAVYKQRQVDDGWKMILDNSIVTAIQTDLVGTELAAYLS